MAVDSLEERRISVESLWPMEPGFRSSMMSSMEPMITVSKLLKSCEIWPASRPRDSIFWLWPSWLSSSSSRVTSRRVEK